MDHLTNLTIPFRHDGSRPFHTHTYIQCNTQCEYLKAKLTTIFATSNTSKFYLKGCICFLQGCLFNRHNFLWKTLKMLSYSKFILSTNTSDNSQLLHCILYSQFHISNITCYSNIIFHDLDFHTKDIGVTEHQLVWCFWYEQPSHCRWSNWLYSKQ